MAFGARLYLIALDHSAATVANHTLQTVRIYLPFCDRVDCDDPSHFFHELGALSLRLALRTSDGLVDF